MMGYKFADVCMVQQGDSLLVMVFMILDINVKLTANRCSNSKCCWVSNVWSCCVHVGGGVQSDATPPKRTVGTFSTSWGRYNPQDFVKRNVGSCWFKSLTGFKLCEATPNNMQQQNWELFTNNVVSVCMGLIFCHIM